MKKIIRMTAMLLAVVCLFSAMCVSASAAPLRTGSEIFEGVSRSEREQEKIQAIYDDLIYRAYIFCPDLLLPGIENMLPSDQIGIKYIQAQRGTARGQKLFDGPNGDVRWYAKDGCKVKVYARYADWSFVELMMNDRESEGTIAWVPTTYVVNKWSPTLSAQRTQAARG